MCQIIGHASTAPWEDLTFVGTHRAMLTPEDFTCAMRDLESQM